MIGKSAAQLRKELDAAFLAEREVRIGTEQYRAIRSRIGRLIEAIAVLEPVKRAEFTAEEYKQFPDSFEQMARNRAEKKG